jgi:DNA-binding NarL/FixJ family response regulator
MTGTLRVFLVDDHTVVREGLKALIADQPDMEVVGEAADGRTACARAFELCPDVVVMDISLPELNGAQATEQLRRACPDARVLVLTVHEDLGYLRQMLEAGASGYVLKLAGSEELIRAIRAVAAGGIYLDPNLSARLAGGLVRKESVRAALQTDALSDREAEVVRLIARGRSNKEIADQLGISAKTVETYKARSLEKLGLRTRADLVRYAIQRGWV